MPNADHGSPSLKAESDSELSPRKLLGVGFIVAALSLSFWVFKAVEQMWNSPDSVELLNYLFGFLKELGLSESQERHWPGIPAEFIALVSVFVAIGILSAVIGLIRTFVIIGLKLFYHRAQAVLPSVSSCRSMWISLCRRRALTETTDW